VRNQWNKNFDLLCKNWQKNPQAYVDSVGEDYPENRPYLRPLNPNKPISPKNFEWSNGKNYSHIPVTFDGDTKSISDWANEVGVTRERMRQRLARYSEGNITLEEALKTPAGEICDSSKKRQKLQKRHRLFEKQYTPADKLKKFRESCGRHDYRKLFNGEVHTVKYPDAKELRAMLIIASRHLATKFKMRTIDDVHLVKAEVGPTFPVWYKNPQN
jgi:hypothetical protein